MHVHGNLSMLTSQNDVVSIIIHFNSVSSFEKSTINERLLCYLTSDCIFQNEILRYKIISFNNVTASSKILRAKEDKDDKQKEQHIQAIALQFIK